MAFIVPIITHRCRRTEAKVDQMGSATASVNFKKTCKNQF